MLADVLTRVLTFVTTAISKDLEQLLRTDEQDLSQIEDGAWDVSALRKDAK